MAQLLSLPRGDCGQCGKRLSTAHHPVTHQAVAMVCTRCEPAPQDLMVGDDRTTPQSLLDVVHRIAPIWLDPCSNPWSKVRARKTLSLRDGENGLERWPRPQGLVYCNPPYGRGRLLDWAQHICDEADRGHEIVAVTPGDFSTAWWSVLFRQMTILSMLDTRVQFGGHGNSNMGPTALWYFGDIHNCRSAVDALAEVGYVVYGDSCSSP